MVKYEFTPQEVKELTEIIKARKEGCQIMVDNSKGLDIPLYWTMQKQNAEKLLDKIKYGQIDE